jgi:hypothetical protein
VGFYEEGFMSDSGREKPIFTYSSNLRIFGDIALLLLVTAGGIYFQYVWTSPLPLLVAYGLGAFDLYRLLSTPLREIRFYGDHLEVRGWKVEKQASYSEIEDLSKKRRVVGDFRSNSVIWFSIKDDPNVFMVPNRIIGKPKIELYSWLLQRNPRPL